MEPSLRTAVGSPVGTILAHRYEIRAPLGRGGMGEVFEAVDRQLDRTVAVKILRPELAADRRLVGRFRREARTTARLSHPGIVGVYDVGEEGGRVFIVMEFVAGSTFTELVRLAPLPPASVARIGAAIADALAHAHERGVVHRDVSPGNLMLTSAGDAKLLDLGIARAAQGSAGGPASTSVRGTPAYVAPEQARGGPTDQRADLYALGVVLTELLTGDPPAASGGWGIERPRVVAAAGERFAAVLDRCRAFDPGERYARAQGLSTDLRALSSSLATTTPLALARRPRAIGAGSRSDTAPLPVIRTERLGTRRSRRVPRLLIVIAAGFTLLGAAWVVVPAIWGLGIPLSPRVLAPEPIPTPTGLTVITGCDGWLSAGAQLTWSASEGATAYRIFRSESGGGFRLVDTVSAAETSLAFPGPASGVGGAGGTLRYLDGDLGVSLSYAYRVQAVDGLRVSARSAAVTADTPLLCLT
ncbi:MAG TPA: serine/threonine-protein kinase [Actinomycetota bacterium]